MSTMVDPFAARIARRFMAWRFFQAMSMSDAYKVLGVSPSASPEEINKAYHAKVFENHPDRGGSEKAMVEVNVAKQILDGKQRPDSGSSSYAPEESSGSSYEDEQEAEWAEQRKAIEFLNKNATKDKKKNHWWLPPHNFMINEALMGWNYWVFSLLPMFPEKRSYRPAQKGKPEGLVIFPIWNSFRQAGEDRRMTVELAEQLLNKTAKSMPSISDTVKEEIRFVEEHFKVTVPENVKSKLVADSLKIAARRMSVDRLRMRHILVPFDGSKYIELGTWD